ncbi:hypothetical protein [Eubacterium xylanophilum]|uniref:hypothetical protein n=1 Tax=Eubacterium xylanophilum TaxID=39497 RepID=UPI0004AD4130|nr:hypothetical protein [Eubacterium xylanophilum]
MENNKIDKDLLRIMFHSIRKAEDENIKTQKNDNKRMVKIIGDFIDRKVREEIRNDEN